MKIACSHQAPYDAAQLETIAKTHDVSLPFARALVRRGLTEREEIEAFLDAEHRPLPDPSALFGMERLVERIRTAVAQNRSILVYGDYDTDGICATAIMVRALRALGASVSYYIPDRNTEGYGLHESTVRRLWEQGVQTLITVDNGISAHAEIALCHALGMEVFVTDHHRCHETLPDADALVCATLFGQDPRVQELCGAGVALLVAIALGVDAEPLLPVAALATIADVVPLGIGNRTIVMRGIRGLRTDLGLSALLRRAGQADAPITETTLAFVLAPRMNAAGRMGDAMRGVALLLTDSETERDALCEELERENAQRRSEEARILEEATEQITEQSPRILVLTGEDWNPGVVGIVASRLLERYGCPTLLLTRGTEGVVGSGRSPQGVDLFCLLSQFSSYFTRFGGHAQAAGVSLLPSMVEPFIEAIRAYMQRAYPDGMGEPTLYYEESLPVSACTAAFAAELERLAPFGEGNREPVYLVEGKLRQCAVMGKDGQHLRALLEEDGHLLRLVAFKQGEQLLSWQGIQQARVLCRLRLNTYRGEVSVNAYADALLASGGEAFRKAAEAMLSEGADRWTEESVLKLKRLLPVRFTGEALRQGYRQCVGLVRTGTPTCRMTETVLMAMLIFFEMGFFSYRQGRFWEIPQKEKQDITMSRLYRAVSME